MVSERQGEMPGPKRHRRERMDEWASIKQWTLWPEQELYESIRPLVLFHETAGERAKEIDVPRRTLARKADEFEKHGMQSLFPSEEHGGARETGKTLPEEIRQLVVDLRCEMPTMSWREIAEVCYIRYGRRPDHKSVKHIATSGPPRSLQSRRYQPWHLISDPAERKLAAIRLHSEGWSITSIAEYLATSRHTIYDTLQRWTEEGVAGLDAKPKTNKGVRKATLKVRNEIRKLQENPLLGEWRVHTALLRMGIEVWHIVLEGLCPGRSKDGIMLAPHGQERRLRAPEVLLPLGIALWIGAIVLEEGQLDVDVAWTIQSPLIQRPGIGTDMLWLAYPLEVLPARGLGCEQPSDRLLGFGGAVGPERPRRLPEGGQSL